MKLIVMLLLTLGAAHASLLAPPRTRALRIRGGADDEGASEDSNTLTEDQVMEKLNAIPTFVVMSGQDESGFAALTTKEGTHAICFFTEPEEAKAILNMTQSVDPNTPLRLATIGLGNALKLCNGLPGSTDSEGPSAAFAEFDGDLKLQNFHGVSEKAAPQLKSMLETAGIEAGAWTFPVFMCEELSSKDVLPIFLNPREIHTMCMAAFERQGITDKEPPTKFAMVDIRMLVNDMQTKRGEGIPWSKVVFIGPEGAADFANELRAQAQASAA